MEKLTFFLRKIPAAFASLLGGLTAAPATVAGKSVSRLFAWYKRLWIKLTHNKYDEFVYKRGLAVAAGTVASIIIIPTILLLPVRTAYYLATYKKETIYLSQSEEIYPDDNIWAVRGCYTRDCGSDTSIYYRIEPSLFHHLWSLGHSGTIFLPDAVGASVPTGLTQCEVVSYGVRLRVLMTFNIYPHILNVTCSNY